MRCELSRSLPGKTLFIEFYEDFAKEVDYLGGSRAGGQGCLTGKTIVFPVGNSMISSV